MAPQSSDPRAQELRLDEVIASYLRAVKIGQAPNRRDWAGQHPELAAELERFFADQDHFDRLAAPLRRIVPHSSSAPHYLPLTRIGNYELIQEIASGGMGVVYQARQTNLNRMVALKMLVARPHATPADLQRFRTEVEAVAQLDHPNIVPIYEVGEWTRSDPRESTTDSLAPSVPYFSMKLVEGGSLAERVKSWALIAGCPAGARQIAELMLKIARAVHFAHQHGILHRDLKPANILVGSRGEPYVTDFGLAKRLRPQIRRMDSPSQTPVCERETSSSLSQASIGTKAKPGASSPEVRQVSETPLTQSGSVLGTPSYMAPEQADPSTAQNDGKHLSVTTASDLYSLGAILYELLTGQPPFHGITPDETVRQLLDTQAIRPRAINAQIHQDLETICLKCLEKQPARRYSSVQSFADDLERFLAGEPIQARPAGNLERAWRWCRRKPIVASLAASLALAVLAGLTLTTWQWRRAERHSRMAQDHYLEAERQRIRAEDNLADANHQKELAEIHFKEAALQRAKAEESFRMAHQAVNDFSRRVNDALVEVPALHPLRKKVLETGLNYYQAFLKQRAHDPQIKEELAATQFRMARITSAIGSKPDALAAYEQAQSLYQELLRDKPNHVPYLIELAHTCNNIGVLQEGFGRQDKALESFVQARDFWEKVVRERPQTPKFRADLAITYGNLGSLYGDTGRSAEALAAFEKALDIRKELVQSNPNVAGFQSDLGLSYDNLAVYYAKAGHFEEAFQTYRQASAIREELARNHPKNASMQADLAISYRRLAGCHNRLGNKEESQKAKEWLEKGRTILARLTKDEPGVIRFQWELGLVCSNLGETCRKLDLPAEALQAFHQVQEIFERMAAANPAVLGYRRELGKSYYQLGNCHAAAHHPVEATAVYQLAREVQEKLVQDFPNNLDCHSDLGFTLNELGLILRDRGRTEPAVQALQKAVKHQRLAYERAVEAHRQDQTEQFRFVLQNHYGALAEVLRDAGRPAEAVAAALERKKFWPNNSEELFKVAREICAAANLASKNAGEHSTEEKQQGQLYADHAVQALREAIALGFKDLDRLRKDPALDVLRQRPDFKALLDDLAKKDSL
jgi:serine/threonine protein kinase